VQPQVLKDHKPIDSSAFDEDALEVLEQAVPHKVKDTGGPESDPASAPKAEPVR
jgi:hypothetical protein